MRFLASNLIESTVRIRPIRFYNTPLLKQAGINVVRSRSTVEKNKGSIKQGGKYGTWEHTSSLAIPSGMLDTPSLSGLQKRLQKQ